MESSGQFYSIKGVEEKIRGKANLDVYLKEHYDEMYALALQERKDD